MTTQPPSSGSELYFQQLERDFRNMARTLLMTSSSTGLKAEVSTKQLTKLLSTLSGELSEGQALLGISAVELSRDQLNQWTLWRITQAVRSLEIVSMTLSDLSSRFSQSSGPSCA